MWVYRLLQRLLRLVSRVFFRQVEVVGRENVPPEGGGPVIFAGNHPNSLIDPVLIITSCGRIVHFAAKDVLFQSRLLGAVMRGLGAVPIKRRHDHDGASPEPAAGPPSAEPVSNDDAFSALTQVLRQGRAMGIFPEGLSHDASQLVQLKTGAARIALGAAAAGVPVKVVPVGITYIRRRRFRSRVLVQFGEPLNVEASGQTREGARALTAEIDAGMRALTINAGDWDTLRVLDGVRRLYQPQGISTHDRVELARRFAVHYPTVREQPEVAQLFQRVSAYLERLDEAGLSDADLLRGASPVGAIPRLVRHLALALIWLPLALPGLLVHAPVGLLAIFAGRVLTPRKDVIATTKLVAGIFGVLLMYVTMVVLAGVAYGGYGAAAMGAFLPLTAFATLKVFDRATAVRRWGSTLLRLWGRDDIAELRAERAQLEEAVVRAVDRFKPKDLVALFPRTPAEPA